ncbi:MULTISPECIES: pyruvate kinase [unclassified Gemella]|uniref:pyruvate kinase n=1 Tax=unclassified Gemella TaxID=2624949 RepID=UPI001073E726|nr:MULTISPECIES: pyruvate kinase [unclassified Gemella]MBF0710790.1 pyruvate kinase [Gemella sp. GL1.1]MBF0746640.1 pyruvate kinase [Gemella sp. 19428wG2_WT2a]NYS28134.1 pyruvate kinase [Gemella sp. GL1]TFU59992.1 pyruvate kinase [Gemella sp. WT2a]
MNKKTKIICTIGPASEAKETLTKMVELGMNVTRLNFSHGSYEEHADRIARIKEVREETGTNLAILLDTKGPEIRTHEMENGEIELVKGNDIIVSMKEVLGTPEMFSITYSELVHDVKTGDTILLDDGLIGLLVNKVDVEAGLIYTTVQNGGILKNKKGVNVPGVSTKLPGITEKDEQDIRFGCKQGVDFIAASFVRTKENVLEVRRILKEEGCEHIQIVPKIECQEAIDNMEAILEVSDGIMIARGDLGVEVPAEEVPLMQKNIIKMCNKAGKFVITATQMLDSMQKNPRPTRAEVSDVANAVFDGTDAIMLSGESAAGTYPVESVETMATIAERAEATQDYSSILKSRAKKTKEHNVTNAIGMSVGYIAHNLDLHTIVTYTESGNTARLISKYRPNSLVLAVTPNEKVARGLSLVWGVEAKVSKQVETTDEMLETAATIAKESGYAKSGDEIIITGGIPVNKDASSVGTTNFLKVEVIR